LGGVFQANPGKQSSDNLSTLLYATLLSIKAGKAVDYEGQPMSFISYPIFDQHDIQVRQPVATLGVVVDWASYFRGVVPPHTPPVTVVLENACDGYFTYTVDNGNVIFEGNGDFHDTRYDSLKRRAALNTLYNRVRDERSLILDEMDCPFHLQVYPTQAMEDDSHTYIPLVTTLAVGSVFIFTAAVFWVYNRIVENRQAIVLNQATQSTAIVSSFLPDAVQRRLLGNDGSKPGDGTYSSPINRLKSFLAEGEDNGANAQPIADLFPYNTVLFADVSTLVRDGHRRARWQPFSSLLFASLSSPDFGFHCLGEYERTLASVCLVADSLSGV
jgi:hypothetical protein